MDADGKATLKLKKPRNSNFSVMKDVMGPLPIPYTYLLGSHFVKKRFLIIGISSVHREKEQYLMRTIESIFSHCTLKELHLIRVVIYLADNNSKLNKQKAKEIKAQFHVHVHARRLFVIQSSLDGYPPLSSQRGQLDKKEKAQYRSKKNVDYAYLVNFCASLSQYYLMLEDDVVCATNFVSIIQNYTKALEEPWTTIAFSKLGCIGKLYHSSDLTKLARFLLMFYDEMPSDWLLEFFQESKAQNNAIIFRPSLFQHIDRVTAFNNIENEIKDPEFEEDSGDFGDLPSASCFTNMPIYADYAPEKVCPPGKGVFWGRNITPESFFTIVFANPIVPQKIQIYTGSAEYSKDILHYGYVEKGRLKIHTHVGKTCQIFTPIGDFKNGLFEMKGNSDREDIDCLRIQATAPQKQWLRIRRINIWVKKDE
ncbi:alpha-1,3-mannosyl-glycoprotein 4-beta-N-acetylglucosaminyltransferase C-like isoform X2 [Hemicordylus capensis]|uniref:alpha-1,3-mannosyl-glycoprotein 4-beta-N-acetylglucosaminyltransferase C-like isoform X2 n=1 Tax=Hemicordylus capensis TaxID=884348 RepID=UPI0023036AB7|nr:alpha-1,3-mannosyl-glycoprotein 4-beta-N-acetylglucosaminyltransferase C-like isoform X2 [Hemicordylus capensis]